MKQFWKRLLRKDLLEHGEINASVTLTSVNFVAVQSNQNTAVQTNPDPNFARGRGRGRRTFYRNTGENDPYDTSIAPLNIFQLKTR